MDRNETLIRVFEQALLELLNYRMDARVERAATCEGFPEWYLKSGEIYACEKMIWFLIGLKQAQSTGAVLDSNRVVPFDLDLDSADGTSR